MVVDNKAHTLQLAPAIVMMIVIGTSIWPRTVFFFLVVVVVV